jgi:hypothetical protein
MIFACNYWARHFNDTPLPKRRAPDAVRAASIQADRREGKSTELRRKNRSQRSMHVPQECCATIAIRA